jgi:hypothetical protein
MWYCSFFQHQPIGECASQSFCFLYNLVLPFHLDEIRAYFGDAIAMYFSFLGFYTTALTIPTLLGLIQIWFSGPDSILPAVFTILNSFWVILFLVVSFVRRNI